MAAATKKSGGESKPTHLIARSRRPTFRRAGLAFTSSWQAWPLSELTEDQVTRVLAENEIDARLGNDDDAADYVDGQLGRDSRTIAELRTALSAAEARAARLEVQLAELERSLGMDKAPKPGEPTPGQSPPLPLPPVPVRQ